uniref:ImmA/IrrE family metallo-endopeptidase n=1 Tax=Roseivirga sp. TaxID=1964215 RepID=UPI004048E6D8
MNTTKKGDEFEDQSYALIKQAIQSGQLGLIANQCKIFKKKGYYSEKRKGEIIFDLTIEVWPPNAQRFVLLYIIECKGLAHNVPVDDIEEFSHKIDQISELNTKGVFVTNRGFQKSAFNLAESSGMMLIQLNFDEKHKILLHKIHRNESKNEYKQQWDHLIETLLTEAFNEQTKIVGLQQFSSEQLEKKSKEVLNDFNPNILNYFMPIPIDDLIQHLKEKYQLTTDFDSSLSKNAKGQDILGYFNREENKIYIDNSLQDTERFPFILAHEIGHFFLHRDLKMNQKVYDSFSDSAYNFRIGKHLLKNDKNWIEWQANYFGACLILPTTSLFARVMWFQEREGIPHKGRIYVDHQRVNQIDFSNTVSFLSSYFNVTKTNIIYRLKQIGILTFEDGVQQIGNVHIFD